MKKPTHYIWYSCQRATELIEKKYVAELSLIEEVKLKMHLGICGACKKYSKQSALIEKIVKEIAARDGESVNDILFLQERIIRKIDEQ